MKKIKIIYSLLMGVMLVSLDGHAQVSNIENRTIERPKPQTFVSCASDRAPCDVVLTDYFSDFSNWTIGTLDGAIPEWELVTITPPDLSTYIEDLLSPSNADRFAAFNGVSYLLKGSVPSIDAIVEYVDIIDCGALSAVHLEFFATYRLFNYDDLYVEVSNDDWVSYDSYLVYLDLGFGAIKQEFVTIDITPTAAEEANVRIRFRFKELS